MSGRNPACFRDREVLPLSPALTPQRCPDSSGSTCKISLKISLRISLRISQGPEGRMGKNPGRRRKRNSSCFLHKMLFEAFSQNHSGGITSGICPQQGNVHQ